MLYITSRYRYWVSCCACMRLTRECETFSDSFFIGTYCMRCIKMAKSNEFDSLLLKLRMTEKRQAEALEDTRAQIKSLEKLAGSA